MFTIFFYCFGVVFLYLVYFFNIVIAVRLVVVWNLLADSSASVKVNPNKIIDDSAN